MRHPSYWPVEIRRTVHLPYLVQVDFATRGNDVYADTSNGGPLSFAGSLNDPTFLYASLSTGYWLYRAPVGTSRVTGIAPMVELHYNRSLQTTDTVYLSPTNFSNLGGTTIGNRNTNIEVTNFVAGVTMLFDADKSLTAGFTTPLGGGSDRQFNGEFRVLFNWYFGAPLNRMTRVQF